MDTCACIEQTIYALSCANIPTNIFLKYECLNHGALAKAATSIPYVKCILLPDVLLTGSENVTSWDKSYHGASVETILSILKHGEFLMEGDVMNDGSYLTPRHTKIKGQKSAIWTYPTLEGADNRTVVANYENGETLVKMLLQLRQRPTTYTSSMTGWGYEIWSTNRRGTIYIESVLVCVLQGDDRMIPALTKKIPPNVDARTFSCPVQQANYEYLETLNIPKSMFARIGNHCYCITCYPSWLPDYMDVAGERYIIPRGWVRFGLAVNPVFAALNDIWDCWNIAYHGCNPANVISILKHRSLSIPHDILCDGKELLVNSSADKNQKCYFLSPSIDYAGHPWYAKYQKFKDSILQVAIVFKVRPDSFDKQRETEGGTMKMYDNYTVIAEDEIEWYSSQRGCVHPYGLLIRTLTKDQKKQMKKIYRYAWD